MLKDRWTKCYELKGDYVRNYSCECRNGRRINSSCSHIATLVYYMINTSYLSKPAQPVEVLSEIF